MTSSPPSLFRRRCARAAVLLALLAATASASAERAASLADAPDTDLARPRATAAPPSSYGDALRQWRGAEDINRFIGEHFEYDIGRALRLSETERRREGAARVPITAPEDFYAAPRGICVDLSRFGVETLRAIAPESKPRYLMIEFAPATVAGQVLRMHWVATFERDGAHYFYADSKRPGHIAGPYASVADYLEAYARYRGREVVSHRELPTYERRMRTAASRQPRDPAP